MSCSTGFILNLDLVSAGTFLWPSKIHSLQGPRGTAGWETPCSAAGLGCLWIVYLVFGLSSPSQFCTKQGTLSFHTLKKTDLHEQLSLLVAALICVVLRVC